MHSDAHVVGDAHVIISYSSHLVPLVSISWDHFFLFSVTGFSDCQAFLQPIPRHPQTTRFDIQFHGLGVQKTCSNSSFNQSKGADPNHFWSVAKTSSRSQGSSSSLKGCRCWLEQQKHRVSCTLVLEATFTPWLQSVPGCSKSA